MSGKTLHADHNGHIWSREAMMLGMYFCQGEFYPYSSEYENNCESKDCSGFDPEQPLLGQGVVFLCCLLEIRRF